MKFSAKADIQSSATVKVTLIAFPTKWDTSLEKFVSEAEFNAIFTQLGRLAAADSNIEQELFDALSYLVNNNDYDAAVRTVDELRGFEHRKNLLLDLYKRRVPENEKQQELRQILKNADHLRQERGQFIHSRWAMPDREGGGVVRIKFKGIRDEPKQVTVNDLSEIVEGLEICTKQLRELFWKFGDYHQWLMKRMPE